MKPKKRYPIDVIIIIAMVVITLAIVGLLIATVDLSEYLTVARN